MAGAFALCNASAVAVSDKIKQMSHLIIFRMALILTQNI